MNIEADIDTKFSQRANNLKKLPEPGAPQNIISSGSAPAPACSIKLQLRGVKKVQLPAPAPAPQPWL